MATLIDSFTFSSSSSSSTLHVSIRSLSQSSSRTLLPPISAAFNRPSSLCHFSGSLKIQRSSNSFLSSNLTNLKTQNKGSSKGNGGRGAIVCEASDTALDVPSVTDATWKSLVLESDTPVMVEFWASWCGPCRMILPIIAELSKQYAGRLKCYKLNTDDCPTIATQYGIRSIPTIMIFVNGEKRDAVIGAVPKTTLTASIEKFL